MFAARVRDAGFGARDVIILSYGQVAIAAMLVAIAGFVSIALRLGFTKRLGVAAFRTVVQLLLLGLVLEWVFSQRRWEIVAALMASMVINAGIAAVSATQRRYRGIWFSGLVSITLSSVVTTIVVVALVLQVRPLLEPRYAIPLLGMVLGNTLTGVSLCLDRLMTDLAEKRSQVEGWLSLGATIWEACRPHIRDAIRTGMVPILNSMTVVGIVSLPGMMTGQILAGVSPVDAVKYQIVVMFMIASAASLAGLGVAMLAFRQLTTRRHQLASDRLRRLS